MTASTIDFFKKITAKKEVEENGIKSYEELMKLVMEAINRTNLKNSLKNRSINNFQEMRRSISSLDLQDEIKKENLDFL